MAHAPLPIVPPKAVRHIDAPLDVVGQRIKNIPPLAPEGGCDNLPHWHKLSTIK